MEDPEGIARGEAAAGLALVGALGLGLVGTIVYRIVQAAPRSAPTPAAAWASQSTGAAVEQAAATSAAPPSEAAELPSEAAPPVAPPPTSDAIAIDIGDPDASAPIPPLESTPAPALDSAESGALPHFVAPSNR
jgi:cytoskeletal protein RodZ